MLKLGVINIDTKLSNLQLWKKHVKDLAERKRMFFEGEHERKDGSTFSVEVNIRYVNHNKKDS